MTDLQWMQHAISLAQSAGKNNEVPVGAVLILQDHVIGEGSNCPIGTCDPTAHAEIVALRAAAKRINNYRLVNSTLYVTLEPCMMCIGAIVHARVRRVVFGAYDARFGAVTQACAMHDNQKLNHKVVYEGGLLAESCGQLLSGFFKSRR